MMRVRVKARDAAALSTLLHEHPLDLSCGGALRHADRSIQVDVDVPLQEIAAMQKPGLEIEVLYDIEVRLRERMAEVGRGNRFLGKNRIPRGLGRKVKGGGSVLP